MQLYQQKDTFGNIKEEFLVKLKRFLSGIAAVIMIISSVAIASFTSASAVDENGLIDPPEGGWLTEQNNKSQIKLLQNYAGVSIPGILHATELYIVFSLKNVTKPLKAWFIHQNGFGWDNFSVDESTPAINITKDGTYAVKWTGSANDIKSEKVMCLGVKLVDAETEQEDNSIDTNNNATIIGLYNKEPNIDDTSKPDSSTGSSTEPSVKPEPSTDPSTDPSIKPEPSTEPSTDPTTDGALTVSLVDQNLNMLTTEKAYIYKDGQFTISKEGLNIDPKDRCLLLYCKNARDIISSNSKIILDDILINGFSYDIPKYWSNPVSPFKADNDKADTDRSLSVCFWDPYSNENSIKLYADDTIYSITIKFTLTGTKLGETNKSDPSDNQSSNTPSSGSLQSPTKAPISNISLSSKRSAAQVKKDKANAEKIIKKAKITKLTVKSRAKKKIRVVWKKVNKVTGYQVQVSKRKNFKKVIFKRSTSGRKLIIKSSKIKSKKTYYVRVRAFVTYRNENNKNIKVYGKVSKAKRVKVKK